MKKRIFILILCAALLTVYAFSSCTADGSVSDSNEVGNETEKAEDKTDKTESEAETDGEGGETVPDFTVYTADGAPVKLSDMRGKPVVLNFWASWCGPCKMEMPDFDDAYRKYGEDVVFMMVNLTDGSTETVKTASDFIASAGYEFPVYYDTTGEAVEKYGISSIPTTFVIDENGVGVGYVTGMIDAETLEYAISLIYEK